MNKSIFRKQALDKVYARNYGTVFNKKKFPWVVPAIFIIAGLVIFIAVDIDIVDKIHVGIKAIF